MNPSVSWDDQRAFLAVLEGGSLSAAGRALGLAQPTVRARIDGLETALGTVLFIRSAQGLLPTQAALALGDNARAMAHASEAFLRTASSPAGEVAGVVRLAVGEFVGTQVLPPMLTSLRALHPFLSVEVVLSNAAANLSEQEADIAVRMHAPKQNTLVQRNVGEIVLSFFAHRDYLARRGMPETLDDLADHDVIGSDRAPLDVRVMEQALPPIVLARMALRTDSHPVQIAAARSGLGIALMHRAVGLADPRLVAVLPDHEVRRLPIYIVAHQDLLGVARVRAAFDHLVDEFGRYTRG